MFGASVENKLLVRVDLLKNPLPLGMGSRQPIENKKERNPLLSGYDSETKKTLNDMFLDFQATRFPLDPDNAREMYKIREVTEDSVQYDVEILKDVKDRVETFRENLREQQQTKQQDGPEEE